jgi:DsbC/DsbD-like thiol-disulfide interchange protein
MITFGLDRLRRTAAVVAIAVAAVCGPDRAAGDASPWDGNDRAAVRLIAGSAGVEGFIRAGIEIRLKPGWHTYWRYPGDAGVPPRFDFAASQNVETVRVLWPAPRRLTEEGLSVVGYTKDVILPLVVVPRDRTKSAMLRLAIDYAVCERLCVPMQATTELALTGAPSSHDEVLAQALARVPKRRVVGEGSPLAVRSITREEAPAGARIIIDVAGPANVDVFAEGPTPEWALPLPIALASPAPGVQRFAVALDGAPPGVRYEGALIAITAVTAGEAIEAVAPIP